MRRRIALTAFAAAALALATVPAVAVAGKGGNGGGKGNLSPAPPSISLNGSNAALGSSVTFSSSYPTSTKNPRIQVMCYQNGELVYGEAGSADFAFTLGGYSSLWVANRGPANCKADLYDLIWNGNNMQQVDWLASTTFDAAG